MNTTFQQNRSKKVSCANQVRAQMLVRRLSSSKGPVRPKPRFWPTRKPGAERVFGEAGSARLIGQRRWPAPGRPPSADVSATRDRALPAALANQRRTSSQRRSLPGLPARCRAIARGRENAQWLGSAIRAMRTRWDRLPAPILLMRFARWISTVRGLIPRS